MRFPFFENSEVGNAYIRFLSYVVRLQDKPHRFSCCSEGSPLKIGARQKVLCWFVLVRMKSLSRL